MATMYIRKSRLTARQQGKLIEHFVAGSTARAAAEIVGIQANTAIRFFMRLRQLIASKSPSYQLCGEVEADESYFGGVRKGKRGRGACRARGLGVSSLIYPSSPTRRSSLWGLRLLSVRSARCRFPTGRPWGWPSTPLGTI